MSDLETRSPTPPQSGPREEITVGKTTVVTGKATGVEVFTMTLGGETIELLPLRDWSQLDVYKWRARGKVPGTPFGLEITLDHVKVAGEVVSTKDPEGSSKLQKLLNEWLVLERGTLDLALQKAHAKPKVVEAAAAVHPENLVPHFRVEVDKEGQVHIMCLRGKETLAMIGLNQPGLNSLVTQGLMHKPRALQVGALHDWVELDGEIFSFEKGNNDATKLEKALNERYLSTAALGQGKEVVVFANAASPTGFDIQFSAKVGGLIDHQRRPLNGESLGLLQDAEHCGLLPKDLVIKLSPPNFILKLKTPDGGERYLNEGPENTVKVIGDEGELTMIDLSRPVNYLRLTAVELTAMFNHPAINQHSRASPQLSGPSENARRAQIAVPPVTAPPIAPSVRPSQPVIATAATVVPRIPVEGIKPIDPAIAVPPKPGDIKPAAHPVHLARPLPNSWLEAVLGRPSIRQDWFTFLVYRKMAEHFGSSQEGYFGPIPCWASSLGDVEDICDAAFRGLFLTQKGGLGYLCRGHIARFHKEVAFLGTLESAIEGIGVNLRAVSTDSQRRVIFIVAEGYRAQFGIPEQIVAEQLTRLREHGGLVMSVSEVLHSHEPIEVAWSVPAEQADPLDPQAVQHLRPGSFV